MTLGFQNSVSWTVSGVMVDRLMDSWLFCVWMSISGAMGCLLLMLVNSCALNDFFEVFFFSFSLALYSPKRTFLMGNCTSYRDLRSLFDNLFVAFLAWIFVLILIIIIIKPQYSTSIRDKIFSSFSGSTVSSTCFGVVSSGPPVLT